MKKLFLCICLFVFSLTLSGCGCSKEETKTISKIDKEAMSGKTFENQILDDLKITDFGIAIENGESHISFNVTNISEVNIEINSVKVFLYDIDDDLILETYAMIHALSPGQTQNVFINSDMDLSTITRVVYEKI